jgi:threonine dehydrogenase-like Zn-dependent dehydrogenase
VSFAANLSIPSAFFTSIGLMYKIGYDCAGIVTEIGSDVNKFQVGDEVYTRLPERLKLHPRMTVTEASGKCISLYIGQIHCKTLVLECGYDCAGIVTEIGSDVNKFQVGDEVYTRLPEISRGSLLPEGLKLHPRMTVTEASGKCISLYKGQIHCKEMRSILDYRRFLEVCSGPTIIGPH